MSQIITRLKNILSSSLDEELLYMMTHIYSISTGKPPVDKIFNLGGVSGVGYNGYTRLLRRISTIARDYGLGYVDSIRANLDQSRNPLFRDFLMRLSEALSSGHDLESFLRMELDSLISEFKASYTRLLETIRVLLGVYVGVLSSVTFLNVSMTLIVYLTTGSIVPAIATLLLSQAALWSLDLFIYYSLPRYKVAHDLSIRPRDRDLFVRALTLSLALGLLGFLVVYTLTSSLGISLVALGAPLLIPGYIAYTYERRLKRISNFIPVFVKNYGALYSTLGNELLVLRSLLRVNIGPLTSLLRKAYARLSAGVDRRNTWLLFAGESGSEIIRRVTDIIYDSLESAADMRKVGEKLGDVVADHINMQKSREQIARSFQAIVYLLQVILVALAQFIVTLIHILGELLGIARELPVAILPLAGGAELIPGTVYVALISISMAAANAIAIKAVEGGYAGVIILHLSILLILSGITIVISSAFSEFLVRTFIEGIRAPEFSPVPLWGEGYVLKI